MYCTKCGNKLEDDAKFCDLCGTPVLTDDMYEIPGVDEGINQPETSETAEEDIIFGDEEAGGRRKSGRGRRIAVIVICAMGAALIAAGILFIVMRSRKAEEREIPRAVPAEEKMVKEDEELKRAEELKERPEELTDMEENELKPIVRDYYIDYAEAYKEIVRQAADSEQGADGWVVYDMDGDGMPELFVLEGTSISMYRWMAYTYDMEQGEACFLGEAGTGATMLYEPENREAGIIAVKGYMGIEAVNSVKKDGKDGLIVTEISHSDNVSGDYYSTPYPLWSGEFEYVEDIGYVVQGETLVFTTGLKTPEGREVYRIPGEAYASSVLQEPDRKYSTSHLFDLEPSTVWVEGVKGTGEGEAVVIDTVLPYTADGIAILPGYCQNQATYEKNGRPLKVTVKCGDIIVSESMENFKPDFADPLKSMVYIEFEEPVYADIYTVVISQAVGGTQYEDTCIAELFPYTYSGGTGYGY